MRYEAVRLFVERAGAVVPGFGLTDQNDSAVAKLCHMLDGIPLAIELAAARTRALSVEKISKRLKDPLKLLTPAHPWRLPGVASPIGPPPITAKWSIGSSAPTSYPDTTEISLI